MVDDEAPAATIGGFNEKRNVTELKSGRPAKRRLQFLGNGPTSLVAAEVHLGPEASGTCGGWLHCNIQVACHCAGSSNIMLNQYIMRRTRVPQWPAEPHISSNQPKN
jgi:hypothetical protein